MPDRFGVVRPQPLGVVQHAGGAMGGELEVVEAPVRAHVPSAHGLSVVSCPERARRFSVKRPNGSRNGSKCALPMSAVR